ncbi:MAG TPA: cobyric acid synthase CobQ [Ruminococcus sp.]|nr:cobyric acid synthase CobQ [Ruminococcus sp.]
MARSIMIQGTMSNVGKSLICAALCRILHQDGYRCAPFKSQNMALNSYITPDGLEIGRAQAMQAEAAGIEPSAYMNPILLKPTTNIGSQVIVNGIARGNMRAAEYFLHKTELIPDILHAYQKLDEYYDYIVIEGAGSPVELNLKQDDIVNMGLAKLVHAPVLLVGDIDRGGIFPQLIGTLSLLDLQEQTYVKGLIVNQFRGDISLFSDGISILQQKSQKPVLGVVPYISHHLEDEDSLSEKLKHGFVQSIIDIGVIQFPKLSNFTDFDVFSQFPNVMIRYISTPEQLGNPDLLILPGTKSTILDMQWMMQTGLTQAIKAYARRGFPVFGICGGFQMLGGLISDPEHTECGGETAGLGLLPVQTVFVPTKTQKRVRGTFSEIGGFFSCLSGAAFEGYEVHMGKTETDPAFALTDLGGCCCGNVAGCYVHGIFDCAFVSGALVKALYEAKGLPYSDNPIDRKQQRCNELDHLADIVRNNVDLQSIYKIMENGI